MFCVLFLLSALSSEVLTTKYNILEQNYFDVNNAEYIFNEFIDKYDKKYDGNEYVHRLEVFKDNLKKINEWNNEKPGTYGVNEFSDLTNNEFSHMYMGFNGNFSYDHVDLKLEEEDRNAIFEHLDWRDYDIVSPVKNQYSCGSCYIFSAVAHIESQYAMKHYPNKLIVLSEQQALDCDNLDSGCHGGVMNHVFSSLASQGGLMKQKEYPSYDGEQLNCRVNKSKIVVKVKGTRFVGSLSEEELKSAIAIYGPLSIGIQVTDEFRHVVAGKVFTPDNSESSDVKGHGVIVVGYGRENDEDYWIIKNSWGTSWGDKGYIRLRRNIGACSIGSYVTMADVE